MIPSEAVSYSLSEGDMQNAEQMRVRTAERPVTIDPTSWVDDHGDCLFRFALMRLRDEAAAEDLVQETLLSAIQSLNTYSGKSSERTWLTGILKHKIIDHYRKNGKQVQFTDKDMDLSGVERLFERPDQWDGHWGDSVRPVDPEQSPEDVLERSDFWEVMNECLSRMPSRVANVFTLREMDGLSSDEICDVLGLSSSNFWVIMHRARMQLRRCIEIKWFRKAI
jgi:RNA polymerase sigma-70 factor, ECF subfamily